MGYTHYWTFNKPQKSEYELAIRQAARVVRAASKVISLSGFSAHTVPGKYGGMKFNGAGENAHEDFILREFKEIEKSGFCKTNEKEYDLVVTAVLIVLNHYLGKSIRVSSDGFFEQWEPGLRLAKKTLGLKSLNLESIDCRYNGLKAL